MFGYTGLFWICEVHGMEYVIVIVGQVQYGEHIARIRWLDL